MIGCGVGLAVLLATYRTDSATVRNALSETLGAAKSVLPFLARGEVTTAEARISQRTLRSNAFDLIQIYEEQAGGTARAREEADRTWLQSSPRRDWRSVFLPHAGRLRPLATPGKLAGPCCSVPVESSQLFEHWIRFSPAMPLRSRARGRASSYPKSPR
jgi:hypothetical protein